MGMNLAKYFWENTLFANCLLCGVGATSNDYKFNM